MVVGVAQTTETEMTAVLETGVDPHQEMTEEDIGTDVPVTMIRLITMKEDGVGRAAEALEAMLTIAAIATGIATGESEKGIFTGDKFLAGVVQTGISGLSESHDMALGQRVPTGVDDFKFFTEWAVGCIARRMGGPNSFYTKVAADVIPSICSSNNS